MEDRLRGVIIASFLTAKDKQDLIYKDNIEFEFGNYEDEDYSHKDTTTMIKLINERNEELEQINAELQNENNDLDDYNRHLHKENQRLNNIINKLEQHIKKEWNVVGESPEASFYEGYDTCIEEMKKDILDKLKELKEK